MGTVDVTKDSRSALGSGDVVYELIRPAVDEAREKKEKREEKAASQIDTFSWRQNRNTLVWH